MLKDTMSNAQLSWFTEVATIILFALFVGAVVYLFFWRKKASWKAVSELPLQDDSVVRTPRTPRSREAGSER